MNPEDAYEEFCNMVTLSHADNVDRLMAEVKRRKDNGDSYSNLKEYVEFAINTLAKVLPEDEHGVVEMIIREQFKINFTPNPRAEVALSRPSRKLVIQKDEITNLIIALNTCKDVNDFIEAI